MPMMMAAGPAFGDAREPAPVHGELGLPQLRRDAVLLVPFDPRHQHGQQDEVREDDDGHADARRDRHLLHDLHGDQQDGDETDEIREQRDDAPA